MKEVVFVTTAAAEPGFGLTGVRHLVAEPEQVADLLRGLFEDPDVGVLALEEPLAESLGEKQLQVLSRRWHGVLVTLPAPGVTLSVEADALQRMVQRALGYHVRLER